MLHPAKRLTRQMKRRKNCSDKKYYFNHGYEPQRELLIIIPMLMQDNSTKKLQFALLLKFESHYPPLCGIVPHNTWDNSTYKFRLTTFRNLSLITLLAQDSSDNPISARYASEISVSLPPRRGIARLTYSAALCLQNTSLATTYQFRLVTFRLLVTFMLCATYSELEFHNEIVC